MCQTNLQIQTLKPTGVFQKFFPLALQKLHQESKNAFRAQVLTSRDPPPIPHRILTRRSAVGKRLGPGDILSPSYVMRGVDFDDL